MRIQISSISLGFLKLFLSYFLFSCPGSSAAQDGDSSRAPKNSSLSAEVEDLDHRVLRRFQNWKEIERAILEGHGVKLRGAFNAIASNKEFHVREAVDLVQKRLEREMRLIVIHRAGEVDETAVEASLDCLRTLMTKEDLAAAELLEEKFKVLIPQNQKLWRETIGPKLQALQNSLKTRDESLPSLHMSLLRSTRIDFDKIVIVGPLSRQEINTSGRQADRALDQMEALQSYMSERVFGQDIAIEAFAGIELRRQIFKSREKPESIWLTGLKGSGMSLLAKTFIDGIHKRDRAHRQHLFTLPAIKDEHELWTHLGSPPGLQGSQMQSQLIKFLVRHSCGRYKIKQQMDMSGLSEYVVENPQWDPSQRCPEGYSRPDEAVLFFDHLNSWGKNVKDSFIGPALSEGKFIINNPASGIREIIVPVTFVLASTDGASLIASRESNGERFGRPLTFPELHGRWDNNHRNPIAVNEVLTRENRLGDTDTSNSIEFVQSVKKIVLLAPISPENLQKIIRRQLRTFAAVLAKDSGLGSLKLTWDVKVEELVLHFQEDPEQGASSIESKVERLIEDSLLKAIASGQIPIDKKDKELHLTIENHADRTSSLLITDLKKAPGEGNVAQVLIEGTKILSPRPRMSRERIEHLKNLGTRLGDQVFGIEPVLERLTRALLIWEDEKNSVGVGERAKLPARKFMFLGPSSTGKTRTPMAIAKELKGREEAMVTISFAGIKTEEDMREKILGRRGPDGKAILSDFMKEYDRRQGDVLFVFDELANCPREVLIALYDILREPVVTTFSDGRERNMHNVLITMTGNATEEFYKKIPHDIPLSQKIAAAQQIYEKLQKDPDLVRHFLEKYFTTAFLARVGIDNVFLYPPLTATALRRLTRSKLIDSLTRIKAGDSTWGWDIGFDSTDSFEETAELLENVGFVVEEQGASIDRFVKEGFYDSVKFLLMTSDIAAGTRILIRPTQKVADLNHETDALEFELQYAQGVAPLKLRIPIPQRSRYLPENSDTQIITAMHEAGHNLVRATLFGDFFKANEISVIPGVAEINGEIVCYEGIASHEQAQRFPTTLGTILREMAVLMAGRVAQQLVSNGSFADAGQTNDIQRANTMAQKAIIVFGLVPEWGLSVAGFSSEESLKDYIAKLPADRRTKLDELSSNLLKKAEQIAQITLIKNKTHLISLGNLLAEKGRMDEAALKNFYSSRQLVMPKDSDLKNVDEIWRSEVRPEEEKIFGSIFPSLRDDIEKPKSVALIEDVIREAREKDLARLGPAKNVPLWQIKDLKVCESSLQTN